MRIIKRSKDQHRLNASELAQLASYHDQHCISLYITKPDGKDENLKEHGRIKLKNHIKTLRKEFAVYRLSTIEADEYFEPLEKLLDDHEMWRDPADCIALFLSNKQMKYFFLTGNFTERYYISDHFYLLPLMPAINDIGRFYLLALSLGQVKLYQGNRNMLEEILVDDFVPDKLEEAVGYDYDEKSLQFRSGQGGEGQTLFHGQGSGKDDKEAEKEKFFRAVDKGLMKVLNNETAPLVLASVEAHYPIYRRISKYPHLFEKQISGNMLETPASKLHQLAWPLVEDYFKQSRNEDIQRYRNLSAGEKTSFDLNDIIPAAVDGRIQALFLQKNKDRYGLYDQVNRTLIVDQGLKIPQASLFNLAAVHTWLNGGRVYIEEAADMPLKSSEINALFRY